MKKIYAYYCDCGRMGSLDGIFVADEEDVKKTIGKTIYFGEVLGKHSEVIVDLEESELTVKSEDPDFVKRFIEIMGDGTISGFNPIQQYKECGSDGNGPEEEA
jgi:hypothetical protein